MALGKPSQTPVEPKDGWAQDNYMRCHYDNTILIIQDINVILDGPNEAIASIIMCNRCKDISKRWILQGRYVDGMDGAKEYIESAADKYKITKGMIANCLAKYPGVYSFTLKELRAGTAPVVEIKPSYNPDKYVEPISEEIPF